MKKVILNELAPAELNTDALATIVRELQVSRRAITIVDEQRSDLEKRFEELRKEQQKALDKSDLDALSKNTNEMKRIRAKLDEDPAKKLEVFRANLERLQNFMLYNADVDPKELEVEASGSANDAPETVEKEAA